jgi:hypothetical protein
MKAIAADDEDRGLLERHMHERATAQAALRCFRRVLRRYQTGFLIDGQTL